MTEAAKPLAVSRITSLLPHVEFHRPTLKGVLKTGLKLGAVAAIGEIGAACAPGTQTPNATGEHTPTPGISTPGPSVMPSETAYRSQVVETPAPTATASEKATPAPTQTPEITPPPDTITIQSFIADIKAGGHALDKYRVPVTKTQLQTDFDAFMASAAGATAPTNIGKAFAECMDTDPNKTINGCAFTTTMTFKAIAKTSTPEAIKFAQDMADHDITNVFTTADNLSVLLQNLEATTL